MALIFLANSDLTEQQRERLTSHLALRNILMRDYTQTVIFEGFKTLFTSTKTGIGDPSVRQGGLERRHNGRQRSFFLYELGSWDEEEGYWAADEEDENVEGFLDINNDIFWTYDPERDQWDDAYVAGFRLI